MLNFSNKLIKTFSRSFYTAISLRSGRKMPASKQIKENVNNAKREVRKGRPFFIRFRRPKSKQKNIAAAGKLSIRRARSRRTGFYPRKRSKMTPRLNWRSALEKSQVWPVMRSGTGKILSVYHLMENYYNTFYNAMPIMAKIARATAKGRKVARHFNGKELIDSRKFRREFFRSAFLSAAVYASRYDKWEAFWKSRLFQLRSSRKILYALSRALYPLAAQYAETGARTASALDHFSDPFVSHRGVSDLFGFRLIRRSDFLSEKGWKRTAPIVLKVPVKYKRFVRIFFKAAHASGSFFRRVPKAVKTFYSTTLVNRGYTALGVAATAQKRSRFFEERGRRRHIWGAWTRKNIFSPKFLSYFDIATIGLYSYKKKLFAYWNDKDKRSVMRSLKRSYKIRRRGAGWRLYGRRARLRPALMLPSFNIYMHGAFKMPALRFMSGHNVFALKWTRKEPFMTRQRRKRLFAGYSRSKLKVIKYLPMLAHCQWGLEILKLAAKYKVSPTSKTKLGPYTHFMFQLQSLFKILVKRRQRGALVVRRELARNQIAVLSRKLGIQFITKGEAYRTMDRSQFLLARQRFNSLDWRFNSAADIGYVEGFIKKKKEINKVTYLSFQSGRISDRLPEKYGYLRTKVDPVYSSFIFNKIINAFTRRGRKKYVRNIFYDLISSDMNPDCRITIDTFYWVIQSLRPSHINVKARRGHVVYRAPILASETKSVMKAIRFFKQAVLDRKDRTTLREKVLTELYDYVWWGGYVNKYYEEYTRVTRANMHLRHYRKDRIY